MPKNFEIKCPVKNYKRTRSLLISSGKFSFFSEKQTDIYYDVTRGRLKLRVINDKTGSLIFYERSDSSTKRISRYEISHTNDFNNLDRILRKQFKLKIIVRKHREIFITENIRIHLDIVKGLGRFLEIEIIFDKITDARRKMKDLIEFIGLDDSKFIKNSYSDILIKNS